MQRICILILTSIPAAGKTTFCRWLLSINCRLLKFNVVHINYDAFLKYNITLEIDFRQQRLEIFKNVQNVVNSIRATNQMSAFESESIRVSSLAENTDWLIVCDDNHYYRSMRSKFYQYCKLNSLSYCQIYFECSLPVALNRNRLRACNEYIPASVFEKMCDRFEPPNVPQNAWEVTTLILNTSEGLNFSTYTSIMPFLLNAFNKVVLKATSNELKPKQQDHSIVHQIDLLLRRRIKELLSAEASSAAFAKRSRAGSLNAKRKCILEEVKNHSATQISDVTIANYIKLLE